MVNPFRKPSNDRDWMAGLVLQPSAEIKGNKIYLRNIRNFTYRSEFDYDQNYFDREYDLNQLQSCDVGIVPFSRNPLIAHMLVRFNFENETLVFSAEVRKQKGQRFIAWKTALNQYELIYIFGAETDLVQLREKHRKNEKVHFHRLNFTKEQNAQLLTSLCKRANKLKEKPEFFNLFFNSCASNVIGHLNQISLKKINVVYKFFAPGLLESELIRKGLLKK